MPRQHAGLTGGEVQAATKAASELESTHRVYRKEWVHAARFDTHDEAVEHIGRFGGRVFSEDIKLAEDSEGTWVVRLRLWNVASEWKSKSHASAFASALQADGADPADIQVVPRNSKSEFALRNYSILKLPDVR